MTELQTLLEASVDHPVDLDAAADVRRGRVALNRRRRRTGLAVCAVAAVVAVIGSRSIPAGHLLGVGPSDHPSGPTQSTPYFTFPEPPEGWSVWGKNESIVVIAPDGTTPPESRYTMDVRGKLIIDLVSDSVDEPRSGPPIEYDGRTFYEWKEEPQGIEQASVQESSGSWLVVQGAPKLGWTPQQMIEYLDAVQVLPAAQPGPS